MARGHVSHSLCVLSARMMLGMWLAPGMMSDTVGSSEGKRIHGLSRRLGQNQEVLDFTERGSSPQKTRWAARQETGAPDFPRQASAFPSTREAWAFHQYGNVSATVSSKPLFFAPPTLILLLPEM